MLQARGGWRTMLCLAVVVVLSVTLSEDTEQCILTTPDTGSILLQERSLRQRAIVPTNAGHVMMQILRHHDIAPAPVSSTKPKAVGTAATPTTLAIPSKSSPTTAPGCRACAGCACGQNAPAIPVPHAVPRIPVSEAEPIAGQRHLDASEVDPAEVPSALGPIMSTGAFAPAPGLPPATDKSPGPTGGPAINPIRPDIDLAKVKEAHMLAERDCRLGDWAEWSDCHEVLRDGFHSRMQQRTREILQRQQLGGRPCEIGNLLEMAQCLDIEAALTPRTLASDAPCNKSKPTQPRDSSPAPAPDSPPGPGAWDARKKAVGTVVPAMAATTGPPATTVAAATTSVAVTKAAAATTLATTVAAATTAPPATTVAAVTKAAATTGPPATTVAAVTKVAAATTLAGVTPVAGATTVASGVATSAFVKLQD